MPSAALHAAWPEDGQDGRRSLPSGNASKQLSTQASGVRPHACASGLFPSGSRSHCWDLIRPATHATPELTNVKLPGERETAGRMDRIRKHPFCEEVSSMIDWTHYKHHCGRCKSKQATDLHSGAADLFSCLGSQLSSVTIPISAHGSWMVMAKGWPSTLLPCQRVFLPVAPIWSDARVCSVRPAVG